MPHEPFLHDDFEALVGTIADNEKANDPASWKRTSLNRAGLIGLVFATYCKIKSCGGFWGRFYVLLLFAYNEWASFPRLSSACTRCKIVQVP
jgi:hypothetical protein